MSTTRVPRHNFSERVSGKSKIRDGYWRILCRNGLPALQPGYPFCSALSLTVSSGEGYIPMDYGTFQSILRQLIILLLTCPKGLKLKHRAMMQLRQSRSMGEAKLGQFSGLQTYVQSDEIRHCTVIPAWTLFSHRSC